MSLSRKKGVVIRPDYILIMNGSTSFSLMIKDFAYVFYVFFTILSKSDAVCLQIGQMKSFGSSSPTYS